MFDIILAYLIWGIWAVLAFNDISPILVIVLFIAAIFVTINALSHEAINDESLAINKIPTILASVILCLDVIALIYSCLILSNNESDENAIMIGVVSICLLFPFLIMAIKIAKIRRKKQEVIEKVKKSRSQAIYKDIEEQMKYQSGFYDFKSDNQLPVNGDFYRELKHTSCDDVYRDMRDYTIETKCGNKASSTCAYCARRKESFTNGQWVYRACDDRTSRSFSMRYDE